jgi:Zn-dependent peptidase ImmA (M78 family)
MNTNANFLFGAYKKTANFLKSVEENREKYIAEELNKKYNNVALPPIWPDKVALGERFLLRQRNLPGSLIAFLDKASKIIYLTGDTRMLEKWENFAIAHVLGHWFMGHNSYSFDASDFNRRSVNKEDAEANRFASYLLMPDNFAREYAWLDDDFARVFRVPQQVVKLRMSLS